MYWRLWTGFCIGKCIAGLAGWLAAFAFFFLVLSFHLISSHFISFHLISSHFIWSPNYLLSCSFRIWNGSVVLESGPMAREIRERIQKEGRREVRRKKTSMPDCMKNIKKLQTIHANQQQKSMNMMISLVIQHVKLIEIVKIIQLLE